MLVDDIFRIDERRLPETMEDAAQVLERFGYKQIGHTDSAFGSVFHKPGDKSVLKIFSKMDYAYSDFVSLAIKHRENPHFPRFSRQVFKIRGTEYDAVKTELLQEGNYKLLDVIEHMFIIRKKYWDHGRYDWNNLQGMELVDADDEEEYRDKYVQFELANEALVEAFDLIYFNFSINKKIKIDLHSSNFMMRGNTIVIIDPVCPK